MADLEDSLKKLDRLTQEEARMALSEILEITHDTRDEVRAVDGKVENVGDKVADVGDKVEGVGDKVHCVDEKVQVVIDGAPGLSTQSLISSKIYTSDSKQARGEAKETKLIVQQTANVIDEVKCSSSPNVPATIA